MNEKYHNTDIVIYVILGVQYHTFFKIVLYCIPFGQGPENKLVKNVVFSEVVDPIPNTKLII